MSTPEVTVEVAQPQITVQPISPVVTVESLSPEITVTASGPPGPSGGSVAITQSAPLSTWVLTHGLGYYPSVHIIDSLGRTVIAPVSYPTLQTVQITFTAPFSGTAYLS